MQPSPEYIKEQVFKAYTRSLRYLSFRPRSEKEIQDFLNKKKFDQLIIDKVLDQLKKEKFVNDFDFTRWWVDQRQEFKGLSKFVIKRELMQKGITNDLIEQVLNTQNNDLETAQQLFKKKGKRFEGLPKDEYFKKAAAFLQRKGFSYDIIKQVLKEEK